MNTRTLSPGHAFALVTSL